MTGSRVSLVIAPSGWGKTTAIAESTSGDGRRALWTRLAPGWDRAGDLVAMAHTSAGRSTGGADEIVDDPLLLADALIELLDETPSILVVDDLDTCEGNEIERLLTEVAMMMPEGSTLLLASQRRPAELVGAGIVDEFIDRDDLRFDRDDVVATLAAHDVDRGLADAVLERSGGWPAAVVAHVEARGDLDVGLDRLVQIHVLDAPSPRGVIARAAGVLPYVSPAVASALGDDGTAFEALSAMTSLFSFDGDALRAHSGAAERIVADLQPEHRLQMVRAAAAALADDDPVSAVEALVDAEAFDDAARLLAEHATRIGPDRATRWLYRLPSELRRSMPPSLAGGRATVNVDLAMIMARNRLEAASTPAQRDEASLALGSALLASGDLAEAAAVLETGLRSASDPEVGRSLADHLARARFYAGDGTGALAAIGDATDDWSRWIRGLVALLAGDSATVAGQGAALSADGDEIGRALGETMSGMLQLTGGDESPTTGAAYEVAVAHGGRELAAIGPVHAWALIRAGDLEGAAAVTAQIERNVARHDHGARLHAAHLRLAISHRDPGLGDPDRDRRRLMDLRSTGHPSIERLAECLGSASTQPGTSGLEVTFLDDLQLTIDGSRLSRGSWKSRKALEVCLVLADAGPAGLRREQLIEAVWPERDPDKGRTLLRTALAEIRRVLEPRRPAGTASRFVQTEGDRVAVLASTDLGVARDAMSLGDHHLAFDLLSAGLATDLPDAEWAEELRAQIAVITVASASRVAAQQRDDDRAIRALEFLREAEPWQREHVDSLIALHHGRGDELAARDVERAWFADD